MSCYSLGKGTYYEVKSWPKADSQNLAKGCELPSCDGQLQLTDGLWFFVELVVAIESAILIVGSAVSVDLQPLRIL